MWVGHGNVVTGEGGVSSWNGEEWTTYYSWTTGFGLRSDIINDIDVDDDNNKWFATGTIGFDGGLSKFTGESWERFDIDSTPLDFDGFTRWLECVSVLQRKVWVGGVAGIGILNGLVWDFDTAGIIGDRIWSEIIAVNENEYYAMTRDYIINTIVDTIMVIDSLSRFYDIALTSDALWSCTCDGIFGYTGGVITHFGVSDGLLSDSCYAIELTGNKLWIGHNRGVSVRDSLGWCDDTVYLSPPSKVMDIAQDKNENILICAFEGLYVYNHHGIIWGIYEETSSTSNIEGMHVYPNPFNSEIMFRGNEGQKKEVYDISGHLIDVIPEAVNSWRPPPNLSSGLYLIRWKNGEQMKTKKICYTK